jgi:hypothetical protein
MNSQARVELTIRYGAYGEKSKTVAVPVSEELTRDLMEDVELSDEPFSLFVASPGVFGGRGDAVTIRRRTFKMRREVAKEIAAAMVPELLRAFGVNDQLDGYKVDELSEDERAWHRARGRL